MNNVKNDITNELLRDKKYLEMELAGLAQNTNISYKDKILKMTKTLNDIAVVNGTFGLLNVYFLAEEQKVVTPELANISERTDEKTETNENQTNKENSPFPKIN